VIFTETVLPGVYLIDPERHADERGFFARTYCADELAAHGLNLPVAQSSISYNPHAGTLRGMHYQRQPHGEVKLVRCTMGAIYDVVIDLRPASPTYCQWVGVELTAENRRMLYIPEDCAHGLLTLVDRSEVFYQISQPYHPAAGAGVRWNDPVFGITWPSPPTLMADRDAAYPDYLPGPGQQGP
jgi:dTDP-4-dehydrorhamnose 3,5-epimerase